MAVLITKAVQVVLAAVEAVGVEQQMQVQAVREQLILAVAVAAVVIV
jgi:hypothetical protein